MLPDKPLTMCSFHSTDLESDSTFIHKLSKGFFLIFKISNFDRVFGKKNSFLRSRIVKIQTFFAGMSCGRSNYATLPAHPFFELLSSKHLILARISCIDRLTSTLIKGMTLVMKCFTQGMQKFALELYFINNVLFHSVNSRSAYSAAKNLSFKHGKNLQSYITKFHGEMKCFSQTIHT